MKEVNLFKIYLQAPEKQKDLEKKVRWISLLVLLVYCLVSFGLFSYWLVLKRKSERVAEGIRGKKSRLEDLKKIELQHVYLKQRLAGAVEFLDPSPLDYRDAFERFENVLPAGVTVERLTLAIDGNLFIEGEAESATVLADFIETLTDNGTDEFSSRVDLVSVNRGAEGDYRFSFRINIKDAQKTI